MAIMAEPVRRGAIMPALRAMIQQRNSAGALSAREPLARLAAPRQRRHYRAKTAISVTGAWGGFHAAGSASDGAIDRRAARAPALLALAHHRHHLSRRRDLLRFVRLAGTRLCAAG